MKARSIIMPLIFCLYLAGVASLCFLHGEDLPNITGTWFGLPADKVAHFAMFFPFIPLAYIAFRKKKGAKLINLLILTILLALGVGTAYMTEIIQEKLGYRSYEISDFKTDCIGLAAGYLIIFSGIILKKSRKRR